MKDVTYKGRTDEKPSGFIVVGDITYRANVTVEVSDADAKAVGDVEGHEFDVKAASGDAPKAGEEQPDSTNPTAPSEPGA